MTTDIAPPKDYDAGSLHRFFNFSPHKLYENRDAKQSKISLFFNYCSFLIICALLLAFFGWAFFRSEDFGGLRVSSVSVTDFILTSLLLVIISISFLRIKFRKYKYYRGYGISVFSGAMFGFVFLSATRVFFLLFVVFKFFDRSGSGFDLASIFDSEILSIVFWLALNLIALTSLTYCWKK